MEVTRKNIQDDLHKNNTLLSEKKILWWNLKEKWTHSRCKTRLLKWVSIQTSLWENEWRSSYQLNKHISQASFWRVAHSCHPFLIAFKFYLFSATQSTFSDFGCLDKMNEKRDHGFVLVYPSLGECSLLFHCSSWVISFVYRYLKAPSD